MQGRHAFCSWCGTRSGSGQSTWPRTCSYCKRVTYLNPLPVAVVVQPVGDGVLMIRRGEPGRGHGELALPGGFVERGESWQQACARELFEETQLTVAPERMEHVRTVSTHDGFMIIVGRAPALREVDLPPFTPTDETLERVIVRAPTSLAFAMHEEVLRDVLPSLVKATPGTFAFEVDHLRVRMTSPTHRVAPKHQPLEFTEVERPPKVSSNLEFATLTFEPLHHDSSQANGKGGPLVTSVRRVRGVGSVNEALAFFKLETGVALTQEQVTLIDTQLGVVLTIDLALAGWAPGNTFVFLLPAHKPRMALYFAPTHWLKFDWALLTVE